MAQLPAPGGTLVHTTCPELSSAVAVGSQPPGLTSQVAPLLRSAIVSVIVSPLAYVDLSVVLVRTSWLSVHGGGPQGAPDDDGHVLPEQATSGATVDVVVGAAGCVVAVTGTVVVDKDGGVVEVVVGDEIGD